MSKIREIAAIVLAAGRASRFRAAGGQEETKLVAKLDGEPIVRRVVRAALAARTRPVVVVVGHAREAVETALSGLAVQIAFNPDFASGVASSLRTGLTALAPKIDGAVILLGDMPKVEPTLIDALVEAFDARPEAAVAVPMRGDGQRGNPVLLGRKLFYPAMRLSGDEGARRLLASLPLTELIEVPANSWDLSFDVDTPCHLEDAGSGFRNNRAHKPIDKL
jgi:molybdenum cofactor cytidylyltransferase